MFMCFSGRVYYILGKRPRSEGSSDSSISFCDDDLEGSGKMAGTSMAWDHRRWRGGGQGKLEEGEVGSDRPLNTNEYWSPSKLLDRWLVLLNSARSDISSSAVCGLPAGGEQHFMAGRK
ncbi:hypothetical protein CsSME_00017886 [Camellia sinensis var. sinensis]